jgi:hypothetical protein
MAALFSVDGYVETIILSDIFCLHIYYRTFLALFF